MTVTNITKTIIPITRIGIEVIVEIIHKTIIDLILDRDFTTDLQVHTHLDPGMTTIIKKELHLDLHIDHHSEIIPIINTIPDQDIDLVLNHKETLLDDTSIHIDLHQDQEIIDQDLEHQTPLDDTFIHIDLYQDQEIIDQDLEHPHKTNNKTE